MMNKNLTYCIVLSSEQLSYLAGSKYGTDRMKILNQLIEATVLEDTRYSKRGFATTLHVGQAALSEVELSCKLGYDKKTISRVIDKMNWLGIVASVQSNRTSIHTLKCVSEWILDGKRIGNPLHVRMNERKGGNKELYGRSDENDSVLSTNQRNILECRTETDSPTQIQADDNAVPNETYFPKLSASSITDDITVVADNGEPLTASTPCSGQPLPFLTGKTDGQERGSENGNGNNNGNGNGYPNAGRHNQELPHTPTNTSCEELAGDGNDNNAAQAASASAYHPAAWASPQPLAEEDPSDV